MKKEMEKKKRRWIKSTLGRDDFGEDDTPMWYCNRWKKGDTLQRWEILKFKNYEDYSIFLMEYYKHPTEIIEQCSHEGNADTLKEAKKYVRDIEKEWATLSKQP